MVHNRSLLLLKKWLQLIFPVKHSERKKVVLLFLLKFLISFVYCILTALKDTTLVTANHSVAEVIPIVKGAIIFPISIAVFLLYTTLSNHFKQSTLFYSSVLFFLTLVFLYGFILCPNADKVSPNAIADWISSYTGGRQLHWIAVFRHWIHVLFFVVAELWGQVVLIVFYWSFVNNVCNIHDAKRFYAIFIAAGDVAIVITAPLILAYTKKYSQNDFVCTIQALIWYVGFCGLAIIIIYYWVNHITKYDCIMVPDLLKEPNKKLRLSLWDSLKHVTSSRYLIGIATMVICCGLSINIVEVTWKSYLKELLPKSADYQSFVSICNFWTGIIALIVSLFFSGGMLRKFGWKTAARVSPIVVGIIGCLFFAMSYAKGSVPCLAHLGGGGFVLYIAIFGGIHNVMAKVVKYAFFDKTTQIAYIPLDPEAKIKGKAAVDLLGSRLGKASSSVVHITLLECFHINSIQPLSGILFLVLLIATIFWYRATADIDQELNLFEKKECSLK